jgi:hypothetical protein
MEVCNIPFDIVEHRIELDTIVPHVHYARDRMNINYAIIIKQDLNKLLAIRFIELVD